ncbi:MAG: hypothetical protein ABI172_05190 [Ginsengibacter sp.]
MSNIIIKIAGIILAIFGLVTLFMSTSVIFDLFGIREKEGKYVLFIVYANLICSFIYLFASFCLITNNSKATAALFIAAAILLIAYIGLIVYIQMGNAFEIRTVKAMLFRTSLTILYAGISWYFLSRTKLIIPANYK